MEKPDGSTEIHYKDFCYYRSSVKLDVNPDDPTWTWAPGQQLHFTIKLKNYYDMDIANGKYTLSAVNKETNLPAFSKESTGISLAGKSESTFEETVVFTPSTTGDYVFSVVYSDETRTGNLSTRFERNIQYKMNARLTFDENVTGKSEVTAGSGEIVNGTLKAAIIRIFKKFQFSPFIWLQNVIKYKLLV